MGVEWWEAYYKWLMLKLKREDDFGTVSKYSRLMQKLFRTPFRWSVANDDNRAADGLELRTAFDSNYIFDGRPCSCLEMLLALSIRCDRDVMGEPDRPKETKLFWIMLKNLGLDSEDDRYFDDIYVKEVLKKWLDRDYDRRGYGGIFCVKNDVRDQRKLEIWGQMHEFLEENFEDFW